MSFKKSFTIFFILSSFIVFAGCGAGSTSASIPSNNGGSGGAGGTTRGTVTLTWNAPTARTDGTSLNPATDITTYKLYYGTSSGNFTQHIDVTPNLTAPYTTTYTLTLASGTYYFTVTDVDTSGQESSDSQEVMKTI